MFSLPRNVMSDGLNSANRFTVTWLVLPLIALAFALCWSAIRQPTTALPGFARPAERVRGLSLPAMPLGLLPPIVPDDNPMTAAKVELGRRLFFDRRLSRDMSIACSTCHDPDHGYSHRERIAKGVLGRVGKRHPPTLINAAYNTFQFWDGRIGELGRSDSLERQVLVPIRDPQEMDMDPVKLVGRLQSIPEYRDAFRIVFGTTITQTAIAQAIAAFERTLLSGDAPFDRFRAGDQSALSTAAARGLELFFWKATCSACHSGPNITDNGFHTSIASSRTPKSDPGRAGVSGEAAEFGLFKTPTLREVARRGPFLHDGSAATLADVIDRYDRGGFNTHYWPPDEYEKVRRLLASDDDGGRNFRRNAAPQLRAGFPLQLTDEEKRDLAAFLEEGLTSASFPVHRADN